MDEQLARVESNAPEVEAQALRNLCGLVDSADEARTFAQYLGLLP
jgi:hypothetical protein